MCFVEDKQSAEFALKMSFSVWLSFAIQRKSPKEYHHYDNDDDNDVSVLC